MCSKNASQPSWSWDAMRSSWASSRRSHRSIRCASGSAPRRCSRSTARAGKQTRSRRTRARVAHSSTSSGSSPAGPSTNSSESILTQEPALDFVPSESVCVAPRQCAARSRSTAGASCAPQRPRANGTLLGRERELDALCVGLDEAIAGDGRLFLVSGEPGIGKSRLIDEFARHANARASRAVGPLLGSGRRPRLLAVVPVHPRIRADMRPGTSLPQSSEAAPPTSPSSCPTSANGWPACRRHRARRIRIPLAFACSTRLRRS